MKKFAAPAWPLPMRSRMPSPAVTTNSAEMIAAAFVGIENIIAQAEAVGFRLAAEHETCAAASRAPGANR